MRNIFRFSHQRLKAADDSTVTIFSLTDSQLQDATGADLYIDLRRKTEVLANEIAGPTLRRSAVVDSLLDLRNIGHGRDVGLELTVDAMLESLPHDKVVSSEWWMTCLADLADHATFLAAGYPPALPDQLAA